MWYIRKVARSVLTVEAVSVANIPFSRAVTTPEKSNSAYAHAVKTICRRSEGLEMELAQAYIDLYRRHQELSTDYTTLHREASRLSDENEFMIKTLNENNK